MTRFGKKLVRPLLKGFLALVVGLSLALLLEWAFGEEFVTRQQAKAYAPISGKYYGEGKRDNIRVLLIDDAALAAAGQGWPARYSYSARVLRAVAQYRPKAVFVDIYYSAQRDDESLPALLQQVCSLHEQGTKVFLAAARNHQGEFALRPELEALAGKCFDKVAVKYTPDEIDQLSWNYTLAQPGSGHDTHGPKSAALALYETTGKTVTVDHHPMALTWGIPSAEHGVGWVTSLHGHDANASYCRNAQGLSELLPIGPRKWFNDEASKPICVYHETIRAGELTSTTAEEESRLRQLIEGKVLLIGTAISGSNDLVLSPLHGSIPGVYLHAMALDNLMQFGDGYARTLHLALDAHNIKLVFFLLAAILVVTVLPRPAIEKLKAKLAPEPDHKFNWRGAVRYVLWCLGRGLVSLATACVMLWIGQVWLGLGMLSVVHIILLSIVAEWFELNEKLDKYLLPESEDANKGDTHVSK